MPIASLHALEIISSVGLVGTTFDGWSSSSSRSTGELQCGQYIAQAIRGNKGQGTATHGTTSVTVPDKYGNPHVIKFSRSSDVPVYARIKLKVFTGYTSQIGQQIQQAISDYINSLMIGDSVLLSRIYSPANLGVVSGGNARYYDIQELTIGKSPGALSSSNIDIRYNESTSCTPENIVITVES